MIIKEHETPYILLQQNFMQLSVSEDRKKECAFQNPRGEIDVKKSKNKSGSLRFTLAG